MSANKDVFEAAAAILKILNVEFGQAGEFFKGIHLSFTPEEWCGLMMREGPYYIGGCCGVTSSIQDIIAQVFRFESGWMDAQKLAEIAELFLNHGDGDLERPNFKDPGDRAEAIKNWPDLDPWRKMAVLWHVIKDCCVPGLPLAFPSTLPPVEAASAILEDGLRALSWHRVFDRDDAPVSQKQSERLMTLYRLLPALKTFHEKVGELNPGPLIGYALIDKEKGGEIAHNGFGLCVYATKAEADELMDKWRAADAASTRSDRPKPIDERIGIRRVRISAENGAEFLDDDQTI